MATQIEVRGNEEVQTFINSLPETLKGRVKEIFRWSTFSIHAAVLRRLRGDPLQSRTGNLARSILTKVDGETLNTVTGSVYSTALYARIHELGGEVRAKNAYHWLPGGPYLNIPTDNNKTAAGVMRMTARDVFNASGQVMKGPEGFGLYLNGQRMFYFAKKVTIPPRLGMQDETEKALPNMLMRLRDLQLEGGAQ